MPTISSSISFGWNTFTARPLLLAAPLLVAMVAAIAANALAGLLIGIIAIALGFLLWLVHHLFGFVIGIGLAIVLGIAARIAVQVLVANGMVAFFLKAHDDVQSAKLEMLWHPESFFKALGAMILVGLAVFVGLILLIVPGIVLALGLSMTYYLVVDQNRSPVDAMKESWRITKGHKGKLFLLSLALLGLNLLGLLCFFVGIFATVPISILAMVHAYRALTGPVLPALAEPAP